MSDITTCKECGHLYRAARRDYHVTRCRLEAAIATYRRTAPPEPAGPGSAIMKWWDACHDDPAVATAQAAFDAARGF